jgi:hypothetical protein
VEAARVDDFVAATASAYERATGVRPEIHPVSPVAGAGVLTEG